MKIKLLTENDYKTTLWSGGKTCQIMIYPYDADFSKKDFIWRISSATVETEKSTFTIFKDYNRYISTIEGNIKLTHQNDSKDYLLKEYELHSFDGAVDTQSLGKCTDYNLMLRKNKAEADIKSISLQKNEEMDLSINVGENEFFIIFCGDGKFNLQYRNEKIEVISKNAILIEDFSEKVTIMAEKNTNIIYQKIKINK